MLKIISTEYEDLQIAEGDHLIAINGHPINDMLDYCFHAADEELILRVRKDDGSIIEIEYDTFENGPLEIEFHPDPIMRCKNKCVFCFIHQLPKGLRKTLYVKDEDYRLSFAHGNYITLTNLNSDDFKRIIDMHLSPLYISVHTTDERLRRYMLGNERIPKLMPQIKKLVRAGIDLHTQIVICPGLNDGDHLTRTINDLAGFYPNLQSVAIVPVGLTKHRQKLYNLKKVTPKLAGKILGLIHGMQKDFQREFGSRFIYPADEFFLMAGRPVPPKGYYEAFPQVENGVGMIRSLISSRKLPAMKLKKKLTATIVTGLLAAGPITEIFAHKLEKVEGFDINIHPVENKLMGKSVTVSGLLGGEDIYNSLKKMNDPGDMIFLPPNCLNDDNLFLDNWKPSVIERKLKTPVVGGCYSAYNTFMPVLRRYI
jgi:putative radical SAM enzyme (TIGR03279 family)